MVLKVGDISAEVIYNLAQVLESELKNIPLTDISYTKFARKLVASDPRFSSINPDTIKKTLTKVFSTK